MASVAVDISTNKLKELQMVDGRLLVNVDRVGSGGSGGGESVDVNNLVDVSAVINNLVDVSAVINNTVDVSAVVNNLVDVSVNNLVDVSAVINNTVDVSVNNLVDVSAVINNTVDVSVNNLVDVSAVVNNLVDVSAVVNNLVDVSAVVNNLVDVSGEIKCMGSEDPTDSTATQRQIHIDGTGNVMTTVVNSVNVIPANNSNSGVTNDPDNSMAVGLRARQTITDSNTETFLKCSAAGVLEVSSSGSGGGSSGTEFLVNSDLNLSDASGTLFLGVTGDNSFNYVALDASGRLEINDINATIDVSAVVNNIVDVSVNNLVDVSAVVNNIVDVSVNNLVDVSAVVNNLVDVSAVVNNLVDVSGEIKCMGRTTGGAQIQILVEDDGTVNTTGSGGGGGGGGSSGTEFLVNSDLNLSDASGTLFLGVTGDSSFNYVALDASGRLEINDINATIDVSAVVNNIVDVSVNNLVDVSAVVNNLVDVSAVVNNLVDVSGEIKCMGIVEGLGTQQQIKVSTNGKIVTESEYPGGSAAVSSATAIGTYIMGKYDNTTKPIAVDTDGRLEINDISGTVDVNITGGSSSGKQYAVDDDLENDASGTLFLGVTEDSSFNYIAVDASGRLLVKNQVFYNTTQIATDISASYGFFGGDPTDVSFSNVLDLGETVSSVPQEILYLFDVCYNFGSWFGPLYARIEASLDNNTFVQINGDKQFLSGNFTNGKAVTTFTELVTSSGTKNLTQPTRYTRIALANNEGSQEIKVSITAAYYS